MIVASSSLKCKCVKNKLNMSDYANYSLLVLWHLVKNYIIQLYSTTSSNGAFIAVPVISILFVIVLSVVGVILWKRKGKKGNESNVRTAEFRFTAFKICWSSVMDM